MVISAKRDVEERWVFIVSESELETSINPEDLLTDLLNFKYWVALANTIYYR